ncbi:MAG: MCP four helix bundle domain-containing protein, partial [Thermomicrobiaceae bacterium]|nr:MCP four helix bundle domain-containing protein [Thermomicrobiaceae bacterium]
MGLGIRGKLLTGFGVVVLLAAIVGVMGYRNTTTFAGDIKHLHENALTPSVQLGDARAALFRLRLNLLNYVVADGEQERSQIKTDDQQWLKQVDDNISAYAATDLNQTEQDLLAAWRQDYPSYIKLRQQVMDLVDQGRDADANALRTGEARTVGNKALDDLEKLIQNQQQSGERRSRDAQAAAGTSVTIMIGLVALAVIASAAIAFFLARSISRAATEMATAARGLAEGDVEQQVTLQSKDELGQIADAFRATIAYQKEMAAVAAAVAQGDLSQEVEPKSERDALGIALRDMVRGLRTLVGEVQRAASTVNEAGAQTYDMTGQISAATQEVAGTIQTVAQGSAAQAEQVAAVATAADQMAETADAVARGALEQGKTLQRAVELAQGIAEENRAVASAAEAGLVGAQRNAEQAQAGSAVVAETVATMAEVRQRVELAAAKVAEMGARSEQIGAIVKTIEDLTEQTNLL